MRTEKKSQEKDGLGLEEEDTQALSSHELHVFGRSGKIEKRGTIGVSGKVLGLFSDAKDRAVLLKVLDFSYVRWTAVHRGGLSTTGMQHVGKIERKTHDVGGAIGTGADISTKWFMSADRAVRGYKFEQIHQGSDIWKAYVHCLRDKALRQQALECTDKTLMLLCSPGVLHDTNANIWMSTTSVK